MDAAETVRKSRHASEQLPLCVDLDGTLLRSDVLLESLVALIRAKPLYAVVVLTWLPLGRAKFKDLVARHAELDVSGLPYRAELVRYLQDEQERDRFVVLVTASNTKFAQRIAEHLGCFDDVMASTASRNLKGKHKAEALADRFGDGGFIYIGDSLADLPVWRRAGGGILAGGSKRVAKAAEGIATAAPDLQAPQNRPSTLLRSLRPQQWLKNLLVVVPLFAAHRADLFGFLSAFTAVAAFCLVASSAYVLNDVLDLEADRSHPTKRRRPFAAGDLSLAAALFLLPALLVGGFSFALQLPATFVAILSTYLVLTVLYSVYLKRIALVDVMTLATLHTLRIIGGATAVDVELSFWLLAFAMFLFLSLALVKRTAEVQLSRETNHDLSRRGYRVGDAAHLETMGIASGYLAVLVIALYINSEHVTTLYAKPYILWLLCPVLLYWISRVWLKTNRGEMPDDPLVFTVMDPVSRLLGVIMIAILAGAL